MFPRVAADRAEDFFKKLCMKSSGESDGSASLLSTAIGRYFHPNRTRYFAVSSIGFYLDSLMHFNPNDCYNIMNADSYSRKLRGDIHPINVLEPLLWLGNLSHEY